MSTPHSITVAGLGDCVLSGLALEVWEAIQREGRIHVPAGEERAIAMLRRLPGRGELSPLEVDDEEWAPLIVTGGERGTVRGIASALLERYPSRHQLWVVYADGTLEIVALEEMMVREGSSGRLLGGAETTIPSSGLGDPEPSGGGRGSDEEAMTVYVPALAVLDDLRAIGTLGYITARLRAPGGCPWDREQTAQTLTTYMIEEAHEAVDAIERGDEKDVVEELGDVLLQILLHSQLGEERGSFDIGMVVSGVNRKLIRRHPHVFGDLDVAGSADVLRNWAAIKREEKGASRTSALDGIPATLPALHWAQAVGRKAATVGFDWPDVEGTLAKVEEEVHEVREAGSPAERVDEIGDLLFTLAQVCRHLDIDAEAALREAVRKFSSRFKRVEDRAQEQGVRLMGLDLGGLDGLWRAAKGDVRL